MHKRLLAAGLLAATLFSCKGAEKDRCLEARLLANEQNIARVEEQFPSHERVTNVTLEALKSPEHIGFLKGNLSTYEGVLGQYRDRLDASLGRPVLVNFSATWCVPFCPAEYKSQVIPFAEEHPEVEVLLLLVDENYGTLAGPDVAPFFEMMYGKKPVFPLYVSLDEKGRMLEAAQEFGDAVKAILDRPITEDIEQSRAERNKGWLARAKIAFDSGEGIFMRPVFYINKGESGERVLLDERTFTFGSAEMYAFPNRKLLDFIEQETGVQLTLPGKLEEKLYRSPTIQLGLEPATPREIVGDAEAFYEGVEGMLMKRDAELAETYGALADEMERYRERLPEGGERFSVEGGSCVTRGPPSGDGCDYKVVTVGDWFGVFEDLTGIKVSVRNLPAVYSLSSSLNEKGHNVFDLVDYAFSQDENLTVTMIGDPAEGNGEVIVAGK